MNNNDISQLLGNAEINRLADLYLSFLDLDRSNIGYRRLKNAVILCALLLDDIKEVYASLAKIDEPSADIGSDIATVINSLPQPIEDMFNNAYCDGAEIGFMPHHKTTDNMVAFLGKTFLYILETNYPDSII